MVNKIIRSIAFVEIFIGITTLLGLMISILFHLSKKPPNVFIFVLVSAVASTVIGIGLFNYKQWARTLLVFFSGYVILTKILVFVNLLRFTGEIITFIPANLKNYISIVYHVLILLFLTQKTARENFNKQ